MLFIPELVEAKLLKRYKRFLADVLLKDGREITIHCPNPGSMMGLLEKEQKIWIQKSKNPKSKYPFVWKLIEKRNGTFICIDTQIANKIVSENLSANQMYFVQNYDEIIPEPLVFEKSRLDFLLRYGGKDYCYIEVKTVTLSRKNNQAEFPDSVTVRGKKHLEHLVALKALGFRAIQLFIVQRTDASAFSIAEDIDQKYFSTIKRVRGLGIEIHVLKSHISRKGIMLGEPCPLLL